MAQHHYLSAIPPYFVNAVYNKDTGKMEEYRQLIKGKTKDKWETLFAKELGGLANGVGKRIPT
eukprot:7021024-Ditylum_brightwellii.AAC.1